MALVEIDLGDGRTVFRFSKPETPAARSRLPSPMVISDHIEPTQSMADGRYYESKSAIRAATKRGGFVEVGNDTSWKKPRARSKPDRKQIKETLEKATARYERGERAK